MVLTLCFCAGALPVSCSTSSFAPGRSASSPRTLQSWRRISVRRAHGLRWQTVMAADERKPAADRNDGRATAGLFGIRLQTNGDVLKFGVVAIAVAYGFKALLQALGTPDLLAGQMTTGFVSVFALLAWVSTYVFRVGTKGMTYAQQLRDYEDEVIKKRYEELTEEELEALKEELDDDI